MFPSGPFHEPRVAGNGQIILTAPAACIQLPRELKMLRPRAKLPWKSSENGSAAANASLFLREANTLMQTQVLQFG